MITTHTDMNIAIDAVDVMSDGSIIAAMAGVVKKSTDVGTNWTTIFGSVRVGMVIDTSL